MEDNGMRQSFDTLKRRRAGEGQRKNCFCILLGGIKDAIRKRKSTRLTLKGLQNGILRQRDHIVIRWIRLDIHCATLIFGHQNDNRRMEMERKYVALSAESLSSVIGRLFLRSFCFL